MSVIVDCKISSKEIKFIKTITHIHGPIKEVAGALSFDPFGNINKIYISFTGGSTMCPILKYGDLNFHTHPPTYYDTDRPSEEDLIISINNKIDEIHIINPNLILGPNKLIWHKSKDAYRFSYQELKGMNNEVISSHFEINESSYSEPTCIKNVLVSLPRNPIIWHFLKENIQTNRIETGNFIIFNISEEETNEILQKYNKEDIRLVNKVNAEIKRLKSWQNQ